MAKLLTVANAVGRLAMRGASQSRVLRAGYSAAQTTLRSSRRVAHILWLQITGVFFCLFAVSFATRLPNLYEKYRAGNTPAHNLFLLSCITLLFTWFGLSSFWKAKRR